MNCPDGHPSATPDYCDVCGSPMIDDAAPAPVAAPSASSVAAAAQVPAEAEQPAPGATSSADKPCPHCSAPNAVDALFCEACGYDHTTGAMPRASNPLALDDEAPGSDQPEPAATPGEQAAVQQPEPEQPQPDSASPTGPAPTDSAPAEESPAEEPSAQEPPAAESPADPAPEPSPASQSPATPPVARAVEPAVPLTGLWVAEVWIDPTWYARQAAVDPLPSPGPPVIRALRSSPVLIGRPSASRASAPDLDCGADTGVSRRHAQLTCDGKRWWVEDLDSSNGTYLGSAVGPLPGSPIPPASRREFDLDDRIYLGSWTRIVVRPSTPEEIADLT